MHKNRSLTLEKYQQILKDRVNSLSFLLADKEYDNTYIFKPVVRSMWHTDFMELYFKERRSLLIEKFNRSHCRMITLTYSTSLYSASDVAKRHKADFKRFVRLMRKEFTEFEYAYFLEITQNHYCHFHVYTDKFYPRAKVEQIWKQCTGSYMIRITDISSPKQIDYCSNYHSIARKFNQEQLRFAFKNISRFFGQSRKFFPVKEVVESNYRLICKIKSLGVDWRDLIKVTDVNETVLMPLEHLDLMDYTIHFSLKLMDNGQMYLVGLPKSQEESPPF